MSIWSGIKRKNDLLENAKPILPETTEMPDEESETSVGVSSEPQSDLNEIRFPDETENNNNEKINVTEEKTMELSQMKVFYPKEGKEVTKIGDAMLEGQTIVLNTEALSDTECIRMIDFLTGLAYAIGGKIERPSDRMFLLIPKDVKVSKDGEDAE